MVLLGIILLVVGYALLYTGIKGKNPMRPWDPFVEAFSGSQHG